MNTTVIAGCALAVGFALGCLSGAAAIRWLRRKIKRLQDGGKSKTSNLILAVLGGFLLAFILAMIVIFCVKGAVPDTLIQYTLGAGGVEALLLAGIKISKVLKGDETDGNED